MMKSISIHHQIRQKALLSLASLCLVFLAVGCVNPFAAKINTQTCEDAQTKVSQAQAKYNEFVAKLASQPQKEEPTSASAIMEKLQESQEQALEICERFK